MIDAIRTAVPAYARPLEGAFGEGIRTGVIRALEQFVSAAEGRPMRPARRRDIYFELGRGEAREGSALDALLAAYRVGARVAWRHAAAAARGAGLGADALAPLAEAVFAFIDELSARSAEGFAYEQSLVAGEAAGRRRALVQLMVARPPAEPAAVEDAARAATWQLPATLAALFWRGDPEQRLASRLPIGSPSARLRDDTVCALVPDAGAPGRLRELSAHVRRRERGTRAGGPVAGDLAQRGACRLRARTGSRGAPARRRPPPDGPPPPGARPLSRPPAARRSGGHRPRPLDGRTAGARARLLETLGSWLDHQGRVPDVARALHVHPQTVRYRLAQLREAFGPALDDPRGRFELALALRAPGVAEPRGAPAAAGGRRRPPG